jgi:hypothetical protein
MDMGERARPAAHGPSAGEPRRRSSSGRLSWLGGGIHGNEQLTAAAGLLLLVLLPLLGITILRIGQLIWEHLFLGLLLLGPVLLKMASTGYRFARYYTHDPTYRHKGPPELGLRVIGPLVVLTTVVVFVSGLVLLFVGPANRDLSLQIHKVSFFAWLVFTGLHVLGHLAGFAKSLRVTRSDIGPEGVSPGGAGRGLALVGALVGGLVLAIVLIPDFSAWTGAGVFAHHHHVG